MNFVNKLNDASTTFEFDRNSFVYIVQSVGYTYFLIGEFIENIDIKFFIIFNQIFILLGCIIWMKFFHYKSFFCLIIIIFFFSEEVFFYSNWVGKESFLFFLTPLITYLIYKKSVFIIPLIIVGSLYRPYFITSIISVLIFLNFFKKDQIKYLFIISIAVSVSYLVYKNIFSDTAIF